MCIYFTHLDAKLITQEEGLVIGVVLSTYPGSFDQL